MVRGIVEDQTYRVRCKKGISEMTVIDLTFATVLSFGLSWVLIIGLATMVRPVFLKSPRYIGNRKVSTLLDLGQNLLFSLVGTVVCAGAVTILITGGATATSMLG